jgi:serine/threonine protein kinase
MVALPTELGEGRYRIQEVIGRGGMATVALAEDVQLGRPVAVKLLADNLAADDGVRARFLREARLAGKLMHPNVVRVYDAGEDVRPYFVMEHVEGRSVADALSERGALPWREAVEIGLQACAGLEHAHAAGIVHRDVKPQNLLWRNDGVVKVSDFGIAQTVEGTALTATGMVLGTLPYVAPERLRGGGVVTGAADVYALGAVLYEVIAGRPPYRAEAIGDLLDAQSNGAPPALREQVPDLPEEVERALLACLATDPKRRPRSAAALARELEPAVPDSPRRERPRESGVRAAEVRAPSLGPPATRVPPTPHRRHGWRRRAAIGAIALLALGGGAAVAFALAGSDVDSGAEPAAGDVQMTIEPAPRLDEPAAQARGLARWIENHTRE